MICGVRFCLNPPMPGYHHMKSRARGGSDRMVNKIKVCFECHRAITDHDGEWTKGYRTHSWQDEGKVESDE